MKREIKNVAVVGAGRMGHGIAGGFVLGGKEVFLCDVSEGVLRQAVSMIGDELRELSEWGAVPPGDIQPILDRLHPLTRLEHAVSEADMVVEAVNENLELKKQVFNKLDAICPERTILASNTSTFRPSEYAQATNRPDKVVGTHYFFPSLLVPLVEIVRSPFSSDETVETAYECLKSSGKTPVVIQKEIVGFVGNRLQWALQREAFYLVEQGIASAQDVDIVTKASFGARMPFTGIFEMMELQGGYDGLSAIWRHMFPHLCSSKEPSPLAIEKVKRGETGSKTGKGFYEWTPESAQTRRKELAKDLFRVVRGLLDEIGKDGH